jgi:hypothetical protein
MKLLPLTALLALSMAAAFGRTGESEEQLVQRFGASTYGKPGAASTRRLGQL